MPSGERRVYLVFTILDPEGNELFRYSLGSYDITNTIAHELGEVGPDERLYHLDKYYDQGSHATLGFFKGMPKYRDVRSNVIAAWEPSGCSSQARADTPPQVTCNTLGRFDESVA